MCNIHPHIYIDAAGVKPSVRLQLEAASTSSGLRTIGYYRDM